MKKQVVKLREKFDKMYSMTDEEAKKATFLTNTAKDSI